MKKIPAPRLALALTWGFTMLSIVILFASVHAVREKHQEAGVETATGYARLSAEHISGALKAVDLTLSILVDQLTEKKRLPGAVNGGMRPSDPAIAQYMELYRERLNGVAGLALTDVKGSMIKSVGNIVPVEILPSRFNEQLQSLASQQTAMSEAFRVSATSPLLMIVAKALHTPDGAFAGAVSVVIDLNETFTRFYSTLGLPSQATISLYDSDNHLLARYPELERQIGKTPQTPAVQLLLNAREGGKSAFAHSSIDQVDRLYVVESIGKFPVRLLVSLAEAQYMAPAITYSNMAIYIGLGLILFSIVLSYFAIRRRQVTDEANALIKSAQDSLMAHVAVLDRDGFIVSVNDGWREFANANAKELGVEPSHTGIGINYLEICQGANGDCSEEAADVRRGVQDVLNGHSPSYQTVYPCHSPAEKRWFQMMVAPLRTAKGGAVVSHTNITRLVQAEQALRESEQHFRTLANSGTAMIWTAGIDMGCGYFNEIWLNFTGRPLEQELGNGWTTGVHPEDISRCMHIYVAAFSRREAFAMDYRLRRRDGIYRWIQDYGTPRFDTQGQFIGYIGHCVDITERKESEESMRKLNQAVAQSPDAIIITDIEGNIEFVNQSFTANTGYQAEEVLGKNPRLLRSTKTPAEVHSSLWDAISRGQVWRGEVTNQRKDGSEIIHSATVAPVRDADGKTTHFLAIQRDITELRRVEAENLRLSLFDPLTGLPNRTMLIERMGRQLVQARLLDQQHALLIIDLDRFKTYNDARGHVQGDRLLVAVSRRLQDIFKSTEMLARMTGDEFALLLGDNPLLKENSGRHALSLANAVHAALQTPFEIDGEAITVTASIGIAMIPEVADDTTQDVVRRADTALHRAKENGGNQSAFFENKMLELVQQLFQIERDLRHGIQNGELRLFLQPQVLADGVMVGAEALVRWNHPEQGLISPVMFVPIAEESDLIVDIDTWITEEVCKVLSREAVSASQLRISVNISPRHFRQVGFVPWLKQVLAVHGTNPRQLTLEVTEGLVIDNMSDVIAKMNMLADMGIHFSLDDFGTGYSSLAHLKRLPINELKIDKAFVQDAPHDPNDGALVETILSIANYMHLKVVAEGVETLEQAEFLNVRAKVIHQGFLFGRPEPADVWLDRYFNKME